MGEIDPHPPNTKQAGHGTGYRSVTTRWPELFVGLTPGQRRRVVRSLDEANIVRPGPDLGRGRRHGAVRDDADPWSLPSASTAPHTCRVAQTAHSPPVDPTKASRVAAALASATCHARTPAYGGSLFRSSSLLTAPTRPEEAAARRSIRTVIGKFGFHRQSGPVGGLGTARDPTSTRRPPTPSTSERTASRRWDRIDASDRRALAALVSAIAAIEQAVDDAQLLRATRR